MTDPDDIADPELVARLAAWFGGSDEVVTATTFTPPPTNPKLAEIEKSLDEVLVARLEHRTAAGDELLSFARAPIEPIDPSVSQVELPPDLDDDEERTYWQPDDIRDLLAEHNTPQAILRDLFRPVMHFGDVILRQIATGLERLEEDPTEAARTAISESTAVELAEFGLLRTIDDDLAELREIMESPWADAKPDRGTDTQTTADSDHFKWFGFTGGYDPDQ